MPRPRSNRSPTLRAGLRRQWITRIGLVLAIGVGLSRPLAATPLTFTTSDSRFSPGVDNQGWWSATAPNTNTNDNYFTGERDDGAILRSFFTFDLSSLNLTGQTITAATLELTRFGYESNDPGETIGFFDVSTPAATLNNNTGASAAIFADLGTGKSYGTFVVGDYPFSSVLTLAFTLNSNALADISTAAGGFFSIGGALTSLTPGGGENEAIFTGGTRVGVRRLTVDTATAVPEPATIMLLVSGLAGIIATIHFRRGNL